ncbi:MAG: ionic transporter y4hA [Rhodomicrobium sp.]
MISKPRTATSLLGLLVPTGALAFYGVIQFLGSGAQCAEPILVVSLLILPVLLATVIAAVLHAEEIAHELGEPYGTLVLTIAVTIIEVALIMSITLSGKGDPALARDTVFSVVMIVCNGIVGLCVLAGGFQYREQDFEVKGASAYLAVLTALSVLTLVLPNFTNSSNGPTLTSAQLAFVSVVTLLLYGVFLYIQTVRHREFFTEVNADPNDFQSISSWSALRTPAMLLIASLLAVVLLSKTFAISVKTGLAYVGAPAALSGFLVALLILLPESVAAYRAARMNEFQRSVNLALGSSLATIGLTVPAVAAIALYFGQSLTLGLDSQGMVLLFLTLLISTLTFGTGRSNILYGFVHLIIFATYIFLIFEP